MQAALFRGGGGFDPDGGVEIKLIPAHAQHFAAPCAGQQDQAHRIGGAPVRMVSSAADSLIMDNVQKAMAIARKQADAAYTEQRRRIEQNPGLSKEAKRDALEKAR